MAEVKKGSGTTEYGPGVLITLTGEEVAKAIILYLHSQDVIISGPRTITCEGELFRGKMAAVYVDPSGFVIQDGVKTDGRGEVTG